MHSKDNKNNKDKKLEKMKNVKIDKKSKIAKTDIKFKIIDIAKIAMITIILAFAILNIKYIIEAQGKIKCYGASMIFNEIKYQNQAKLNLSLFLFFMLGLIITYLIIAIKEKKEANNIEIKKTFIFIAIITFLAGIILLNNSTDVYYYAAVGRMDAKYGINMYEENFNEHQKDYLDDEVIQASPGIEHKFIYGPIWSLVCKLLGGVGINSTLVILSLFKILNIIVHLLNCYLIWKISKNKKLVLLYGLNPLMLFEGIINVHNDIFLILFSLIGIYLKKQNKIELAVLSIAFGALIKYIPVLLLPYILKDEKIKKKLGYYIEFILIFLGVTWLETGKISSILTVMGQTSVFANSLYLQLILSGVSQEVVLKLALIGKIAFCIFYFIQIFIRRKNEGKNYMYLLMLFLLLVITNFRAWYIMWLFAIITELNIENVYKVVGLTLIAEFANSIIYYLGEGYIYGGYYFMTVIILFSIYVIMNMIAKNYNIKNMIQQKNERKD